MSSWCPSSSPIVSGAGLINHRGSTSVRSDICNWSERVPRRSSIVDFVHMSATMKSRGLRPRSMRETESGLSDSAATAYNSDIKRANAPPTPTQPRGAGTQRESPPRAASHRGLFAQRRSREKRHRLGSGQSFAIHHSP